MGEILRRIEMYQSKEVAEAQSQAIKTKPIGYMAPDCI